MIPDTLLSLVLFVGAIGPGYVFVRVAERRSPRGEPSAFREVAELLLAGGASTTISGLVVLTVAQQSGVIDAASFLLGGRAYLVAHSGSVLLVTLTILASSYLLGWAAARIIHRGQRPSLNPRQSVWYAAVTRARGTPDNDNVEVTVELADGRAVAGHLLSYEAGIDAESRDVAILYPWVRTSRSDKPVRLDVDVVIIPGNEIRYASLR